MSGNDHPAPRAPDATALQEEIERLGPWFQNLDLGGVLTAPEHFLGDYPRSKWQRFAHVVPERLDGLSVLEVGCNAGFYAMEMKRRGATRVVGIDSDERYVAQARLATRRLGVDVDVRLMSVYAVGSLRERFDLVLCLGVLYHLRHPLLALELLHEHVVGDRLLVQCLLRGSEDVLPLQPDYPFEERAIFEEPGFPRLHFVERRYSHDPTNWWIPNKACFDAMVRSAGFDILASPQSDVLLCRRAARPPHVPPPPEELPRG